MYLVNDCSLFHLSSISYISSHFNFTNFLYNIFWNHFCGLRMLFEYIIVGFWGLHVRNSLWHALEIYVTRNQKFFLETFLEICGYLREMLISVERWDDGEVNIPFYYMIGILRLLDLRCWFELPTMFFLWFLHELFLSSALIQSLWVYFKDFCEAFLSFFQAAPAFKKLFQSFLKTFSKIFELPSSFF